MKNRIITIEIYGLTFIALLVLVFMLSGCRHKTTNSVKDTYLYEDCKSIVIREMPKEFFSMDIEHYVCNGVEVSIEKYQLSSDFGNVIDLMLLEQSRELLQIMADNMVQYNKEDNAIYADCYITNENTKWCDIVLDLDTDWALLTENEYQDLLQRIEELEKENER